MRFRPRYSATGWNGMVDAVLRGTPRPGRNCSLRDMGKEGTAVDYTGREWLHPWQLLPFWHEAKGKWCVAVNPGFVNGREPAMAMAADDLGPDPSVLGNHYAQGSTGLPAKKDLFVGLTDDPQPFLVVNQVTNPLEPDLSGATVATDQPIEFASITGVKKGSYPEVFKYMGVKPPEEIDLPGVEHVVPLFDEVPGTRDLLACDVVLTVDRPATTAANTVDLLGVPIWVGFNVSLPDTTVYGCRLGVVGKYEAPPEPTLLDRILGDYQEPSYDQLKLATLYFISPPDYDGGLDGSWYPIARHEVFWNLHYQTLNRFDVTKQTFLPNPLNWSPAAGFLGQVLVNQADDDYAQALNALSQASTRGYFWTA